jgi:hypothetical protein
VWQKRLAVLTEIKIGAERTVVDRVIATTGYQPIGKAENCPQAQSYIMVISKD